MHALSDSDILSVWERGAASQPVFRALIVLAFACSDMTPEAMAGLSVGRRDHLLLEIRERTFGSKLSCLVRCPGCGEQLDLAFDASEIRAGAGEDLSKDLSVQAFGFMVEFRLPNSLDLAAILECTDTASARSMLLGRCILSARRDGEEILPRRLPPELINLIEKKMDEADPQADIQLSLYCPSCSRQWSQTFDIALFLWSEIDFWARRILEEVHALARAYGWSEMDILALNPRRRGIYLEMANR